MDSRSALRRQNPWRLNGLKRLESLPAHGANGINEKIKYASFFAATAWSLRCGNRLVIVHCASWNVGWCPK
jgi:hypothetical protein